MKVTFVTHSCYFVETESFSMLFDYFEGALPEADPALPLYVFHSHSHPDHFSEKVFEAVKAFEDVNFILSSDIFRSRVPDAFIEKAVFVSPEKSFSLNGLSVSTLASTDMGVAFLIDDGKRSYYHAGDLNCWVWNGAPASQNTAMEGEYLSQMKKLSGKDIFLAFVPLDPRQEEDFYRGMLGFLEAARARYVFPMHMWGDFSVVERFLSDGRFLEYLPCFMPVRNENQSFEIDPDRE